MVDTLSEGTGSQGQLLEHTYRYLATGSYLSVIAKQALQNAMVPWQYFSLPEIQDHYKRGASIAAIIFVYWLLTK